ncbi:ester cyclase, partial [Streptomyces flaveolus]|uniref:ester cyclase n=1 Tax=Streptomyces flaveolus TaxID=67297 RepID=UPI0034496B45
MDRRAFLNSSSAALGAAALVAVAGGTGNAGTLQGHVPFADLGPYPDPASTPVPNPPFPKHLTATERAHLRTFDELDFDVFSHQRWDRLDESHASDIRVHWPDGHYTDGIEQHIADLKAQFVWAPDTRINSHPLRIAMNELTAVTGVMQGTFTRPMPDGKGGYVKPTGKAFSINMATVGIWNAEGVMSEEFLFWDNQNFFQQLGL